MDRHVYVESLLFRGKVRSTKTVFTLMKLVPPKVVGKKM